MTASDIIARAREAGVTLRVYPPDRLWAGPAARVTENLADLIRSHKPAIVATLPATPGATNRCRHGIDPSTWQDRPDPKRKGWLRTRCVRCGGFVGYRPEAN
jgi:hypothetical protein